MRPLPYVAQLERFDKPRITSETLARMHRLALQGKTDWRWIRLITRLVGECPPKNYLCEAHTLYQAFHSMIWGPHHGHFKLRYIRDPNHVELIESVWHLLERGGSDCDGMSMLYAAAVGAIGAPYRFTTINADPERPSEPSHVYTQVYVKDIGWLSADLTVPKATLGWQAQGYTRVYWPEPRGAEL